MKEIFGVPQKTDIFVGFYETAICVDLVETGMGGEGKDKLINTL